MQTHVRFPFSMIFALLVAGCGPAPAGRVVNFNVESAGSPLSPSEEVVVAFKGPTSAGSQAFRSLPAKGTFVVSASVPGRETVALMAWVCSDESCRNSLEPPLDARHAYAERELMFELPRVTDGVEQKVDQTSPVEWTLQLP
jgi:hypothetical protein